MEELGYWDLVTGFIWWRKSHIGSVEMDLFIGSNSQDIQCASTKNSLRMKEKNNPPKHCLVNRPLKTIPRNKKVHQVFPFYLSQYLVL